MRYTLGREAQAPEAPRHVHIAGGKRYVVCKDGSPYLEVTAPDCPWNPFSCAYLFKEHLCVGFGESVCFVHLETLAVKELPVDLYFGYFYEHAGRLYVACANSLYCLDADCGLVWVSAGLAVDGVTVQGFEAGVITLSCEMDPPGGWVEKRLSMADGSEL